MVRPISFSYLHQAAPIGSLRQGLNRERRTRLVCDMVVRAARLMVGVPDYDSYVVHRRTNHPVQPIMTCQEFFVSAGKHATPSAKAGSAAAEESGHARTPWRPAG